MRNRTAPALAGLLALASLAGGEEPQGSAYQLDIRLDPPKGTIEVKAEIRWPRASTFTLTRDLAIRRVDADGKVVSFRESPSPDASSREVTVAGDPPRRLVVEYSGPILPDTYPRIMSQVNMVQPGLVELASYVGWYPRAKDAGAFTFRLRVDAPAGFVTLTNGRLVRQEPATGERAVSEWESYEPTWDIVVLSAPGLRRAALTAGGARIEIYGARLPQDDLERTAGDVVRAAEELSRLTGAPLPADVVKLVYSPRPGWGYVRRPLILVSEEGALALRPQRFGRERDLRYIAHEIAHYWWHLADAGTPEDWINEGFSDYLALLASGTLAGRELFDELLAECEERSAASATTSAIAETPGDSRDREVNRYTRPVLILEAARRKYGTDRVVGFIQALYRRFVQAGRATTEAFLDQAERSLGREARETFSEALYRKRWEDAAPRHAYSPGDAAFLGTWSGPLTQAGATNQVVLHLVEKDGALVATLGNPDPGAPDIPVPAVRVSGQSLYFGLGAFGISYRGALSADGRTLQGEWKQGGASSPLTLSKGETAPRP